jgi:hypothetical protein
MDRRGKVVGRGEDGVDEYEAETNRYNYGLFVLSLVLSGIQTGRLGLNKRVGGSAKASRVM